MHGLAAVRDRGKRWALVLFVVMAFLAATARSAPGWPKVAASASIAGVVLHTPDGRAMHGRLFSPTMPLGQKHAPAVLVVGAGEEWSVGAEGVAYALREAGLACLLLPRPAPRPRQPPSPAPSAHQEPKAATEEGGRGREEGGGGEEAAAAGAAPPAAGSPSPPPAPGHAAAPAGARAGAGEEQGGAVRAGGAGESEGAEDGEGAVWEEEEAGAEAAAAAGIRYLGGVGGVNRRKLLLLAHGPAATALLAWGMRWRGEGAGVLGVVALDPGAPLPLQHCEREQAREGARLAEAGREGRWAEEEGRLEQAAEAGARATPAGAPSPPTPTEVGEAGGAGGGGAGGAGEDFRVLLLQSRPHTAARPRLLTRLRGALRGHVDGVTLAGQGGLQPFHHARRQVLAFAAALARYRRLNRGEAVGSRFLSSETHFLALPFMLMGLHTVCYLAALFSAPAPSLRPLSPPPSPPSES